jgi:hypothetical protein
MGLRKRFLVVVVGVPGSPAEAQRSEVGRFRTRGSAEDAGRDEWRRILFVHAPHVDRYRIVIEGDGVEVGEVPMPELPADTGPGILDETVTPLGASVGALGEPIEAAAEPDATVAESAPDADAPPEQEPQPDPVPDPVPADGDSGAGSEVIGATGEMQLVDEDDLAATGEHRGMADEVAVTGEVPVVTDEGADGSGAANGDGSDTGDATATAPPPLPIEEPPDGPVPDDIIQRFADMVRAEEERAAERSARQRGDAG